MRYMSIFVVDTALIMKWVLPSAHQETVYFSKLFTTAKEKYCKKTGIQANVVILKTWL